MYQLNFCTSAIDIPLTCSVGTSSGPTSTWCFARATSRVNPPRSLHFVARFCFW